MLNTVRDVSPFLELMNGDEISILFHHSEML